MSSRFTTPGSNAIPDTITITDFTHATDEIAFTNSGFSLKLSGADSTPRPLPVSLFLANTTGTFATTNERFAYDTSTGALYYGAHGSGSSRELVAALSGHPTLAATDLFYVS
jgi:hypothetical protein